MLIASSRRTPANFPEHVFEAGHRFGENGVNGAVFDVLRKQSRGRNDRQQRRKNRDRAERYVFQDLKLLLKRELRHEDRAADQKQRKNKEHVKDPQTRQLSERIECDGEDPRDRESAMRLRRRRSAEALKR